MWRWLFDLNMNSFFPPTLSSHISKIPQISISDKDKSATTPMTTFISLFFSSLPFPPYFAPYFAPIYTPGKKTWKAGWGR